MDLLRRLFPRPTQPVQAPVAPFIPVSGRDDEDQLCFVSVGDAAVPGATYDGYQRDVQDWSSGIRLEHPRTGWMLRREDDYPPDFLAAGARVVALAGIQHHADGQRDEFAIGHFVQLAPEPGNPVNPSAIAIRSLDGRYLAGYVPDDDLDRIHATIPAPRVGLVVWDHWTWRPHVRLGLRILVGPSIHVQLIDTAASAAEQARRDEHYARGRAEWEAEREAERLAAQERKRAAQAARDAARAERSAERARRATDRAERSAQAATWRAAGRCVDCGTPVELGNGRGRPAIRCAVHRTARLTQ
ncbi:MAG TPA: hypothetical protein VIM30_00735 [Candidatus Limnocylindrales bacterium]